MRVDPLRVLVAFGTLDQLPGQADHAEPQRHRFNLRISSLSNSGRRDVERAGRAALIQAAAHVSARRPRSAERVFGAAAEGP